MTPALEVRELVMDYGSRRGRVRALDGVDLVVAPAEVIGIVGESGSGKSTLGAAIGRLPVPGVRHVSGEILIGGRAIFGLGDDDLRALRRSELGFVSQDPLGALDPTMKVGAQVAGVLEGSRNNAAVDAVLTRVGLMDVRRVARSYPHELSGGMAQRVAIGIGIANRPKVLVVDEPTAALDAAIKLQILDLLVSRSREPSMRLLRELSLGDCGRTPERRRSRTFATRPLRCSNTPARPKTARRSNGRQRLGCAPSAGPVSFSRKRRIRGERRQREEPSNTATDSWYFPKQPQPLGPRPVAARAAQSPKPRVGPPLTAKVL